MRPGKSLIELVKIRSSQINGCAYCIHMHCSDARKLGETEMRIYLLPAWRESSLYSGARAALAWTGSADPAGGHRRARRRLRRTGPPLQRRGRVNLTLVINMINGWNRIAVGFRSVHPKD